MSLTRHAPEIAVYSLLWAPPVQTLRRRLLQICFVFLFLMICSVNYLAHVLRRRASDRTLQNRDWNVTLEGEIAAVMVAKGLNYERKYNGDVKFKGHAHFEVRSGFGSPFFPMDF
ncbi:hypothetical protein NQD34_011560 [Periophthalmus magnuspinnatus]|nr:hypothetical protein NQD34_011560 [Periophthalmus magnuspinnatus]